MSVKEVIVTLKFDSVEEMNAHFAEHVGYTGPAPEVPYKGEPKLSAPITNQAPKGALDGEILDPLSGDELGDEDFDSVEAAPEHDSTGYLDFMRASIPVIGKETLKKIMLKVGHTTAAGTPAGVKDPLPSPALQLAIMAQVEKALAVKAAKSEAKPAEEAPAAATEELTSESYMAKIDEYHANPVVGMPGLRSASISVGHVNPKNGGAVDPRTASKDKWAAILAHLEAFKTKNTVAA